MILALSDYLKYTIYDFETQSLYILFYYNNIVHSAILWKFISIFLLFVWLVYSKIKKNTLHTHTHNFVDISTCACNIIWRDIERHCSNDFENEMCEHTVYSSVWITISFRIPGKSIIRQLVIFYDFCRRLDSMQFKWCLCRRINEYCLTTWNRKRSRQ